MFQEFTKATPLWPPAWSASSASAMRWGASSGHGYQIPIGRRTTFAVMFILQIGLFWFLPSLHTVAIVTIVSFHHPDVLRRRLRHHAGVHRGLLWFRQRGFDLRFDPDAWGFASAFGRCSSRICASPPDVFQRFARHRVVMALSAVLPLLVRPLPAGKPPLREREAERTASGNQPQGLIGGVVASPPRPLMLSRVFLED